jgi:NAD+ kinase
MKIALYGRKLAEANRESVAKLFQCLKLKTAQIHIHTSFLKELKGLNDEIESMDTFSKFEDLDRSFDLFISIGGDGTILEAVTLIRDLNIPILGINTGRLGFLSNTKPEEIEYAIDCFSTGDFRIDKRTLLEVKTECNLFGDTNFALNELSILKRDSSSMITIQTYLDDSYLNSYWADGLIVSTATGSTAYSLSCGGPIIMPGTGNFTLTPIAPHNLNVRPIVIADSSVLKFTVESRASQNLLALDFRSKVISSKETIIVQKANFSISLIQLPNQSFVSSLRNKLNWGLDQRNK